MLGDTNYYEVQEDLNLGISGSPGKYDECLACGHAYHLHFGPEDACSYVDDEGACGCWGYEGGL